MKTYHYTINNDDTWRITDTEIIVIADGKIAAKKLLIASGYYDVKSKELVEIKIGVHVIQHAQTE